MSYSGQCYASQACYGRSANRGECAQFCRLGFDLVDADGKVIVRNKHLLSLKDMNQSENLEALLDAGASSLKIEGRLKDVSYVKNVTAYYRQRLDAILKLLPEVSGWISVRSWTKVSAAALRIILYADAMPAFSRLIPPSHWVRRWEPSRKSAVIT